MKGMSRDKIAPIQKEINLLKKLSHPNIVKYIGTLFHHLDSIFSDNFLYIVLEYVEGGSLFDVVKAYGPRSERVVARYIRQALLGLEYLHNQGVIHRDIKGANMLVTKEGNIKLADFDVAIHLNENDKMDSSAGTSYWSKFGQTFSGTRGNPRLLSNFGMRHMVTGLHHHRAAYRKSAIRKPQPSGSSAQDSGRGSAGA